ncbi:MAG: OmpA family protein [Bacteroidetes bacterium]|jgi:outer membrane protein OmpA-like peptidoglycan-associated protein|nr:OmpA family protein [Bacteroidota bacterium]
MKYLNRIPVIATISIFILGSACHTRNKTQKGAAIGAGTGGIVGGFIGKSAGNTALGTIIGGAVGGTAGAFIGRNMDRQANELKSSIPGATVTRQGEGIIINFDSGILFDVGKAEIKAKAQTNLQNLASSLGKNPETDILIIGHTDNSGDGSNNIDLSVRRAAAVKNYLVSNEVKASRLKIDGRGSTEPIADNNTAAGRALNRRVEIVIVANNKMKKQAESEGK